MLGLKLEVGIGEWMIWISFRGLCGGGFCGFVLGSSFLFLKK